MGYKSIQIDLSCRIRLRAKAPFLTFSAAKSRSPATRGRRMETYSMGSGFSQNNVGLLQISVLTKRPWMKAGPSAGPAGDRGKACATYGLCGGEEAEFRHFDEQG